MAMLVRIMVAVVLAGCAVDHADSVEMEDAGAVSPDAGGLLPYTVRPMVCSGEVDGAEVTYHATPVVGGDWIVQCSIRAGGESAQQEIRFTQRDLGYERRSCAFAVSDGAWLMGQADGVAFASGPSGELVVLDCH